MPTYTYQCLKSGTMQIICNAKHKFKRIGNERKIFQLLDNWFGIASAYYMSQHFISYINEIVFINFTYRLYKQVKPY